MAATSFLQTDDGDLALTGNRLALVEGQQQIRQALLGRLRVFQGEWFLDVDAGTPWFQRILGKNLNPRGAEAALKAVIAETPGVTRLVQFSFNVDPATRQAQVAFEVGTDFGNVAIEQEIG
jgi:hypothetical protein